MIADLVEIVFYLFIILIVIAMFMWFGFAAGSAVGSQFGTEKDSEDTGGFLGMLAGLAFAVYLIFFAI